MQADFSVELGQDDPALEFPWSSSNPALRYFDLKNFPALISQIPEAAQYPELRLFLLRINSPEFPLQTAKCDVWHSQEITPEEEIFAAGHKFVSYMDLIFADDVRRLSFSHHEQLAAQLCRMLQSTPEIKASAEFVIRHCHFHPRQTATMQTSSTSFTNGAEHNADSSQTGFCISAYVTGFGDDDRRASHQWSIAISLLQYALIQASHGELFT
ncbi:MAG TPA: hypothetical protein VFB79_12330 [Candidatus Angelobacter sp.]|nr:hypothetical protein [Candidatus Angelobacter sp.]